MAAHKNQVYYDCMDPANSITVYVGGKLTPNLKLAMITQILKNVRCHYGS